MRRREFIAGIGSAAAWPAVARAQQAKPVIGYLDGRSLESDGALVSAFLKALNEAGYVEGKNVAIEYRWAHGDVSRIPELVADLVRRRVSVIVAIGGTVYAAKAATSTFSGQAPILSGPASSLALTGPVAM